MSIKRGSEDLLHPDNDVIMSEKENEAKKLKIESSGVGTIGSSESNGSKMLNDSSSNCPSPSPSRVVHIRNVPMEATENDVLSIGTPFGKITNVLLLRGKGQAFLEFVDSFSAQQMVNYWADPNNLPIQPCIRGRQVYVQFSNHKELKKSLLGPNADGSYQSTSPPNSKNNSSNGDSLGASTVLRVIVDNIVYPVSLDTFYQIFSRFGKVTKIVTFTKNATFQALIQYESSFNASTAKQALDGQQMFSSGNVLRIEFSKLSNINVKYNNDKSRDFTNPLLPPGGSLPGSMAVNPSHAFSTLSSPGLHGMGSVLLASNLNEQMVTPDAIFTLFGVYGDVMRVKILFHKKDNALIQMSEPQQAQLAMTYLDKVKLFGKPMKISASKYSCVQTPKEGQPDSGFTKDFTNSTLHRFKKPGSRNYQNIYPPSSTLHLSNIPSSANEEDIREAFEQIAGVQVVNFKFFPKDRKMALTQLASAEDAVHALIKMHNYQLSEASHLRVSFSKSSI
ncbi:polypyrimidine tract-binding protein 2-like isoform X1 [Panonychus citri]|uniref:polypyrimidine tract-binding protein 2-like isoform X1 n=1 Tax=Panonychus citri TaxID=50023 RepID=UPI0023071C32|nr:polypyrimidine tract-binding protein 2-like isoform X1 [Panonychus citri]XP_053214975.1 polypyrimidine tract-binding protein 2-like isoform X1 [Panonychus citri]